MNEDTNDITQKLPVRKPGHTEKKRRPAVSSPEFFLPPLLDLKKPAPPRRSGDSSDQQFVRLPGGNTSNELAGSRPHKTGTRTTTGQAPLRLKRRARHRRRAGCSCLVLSLLLLTLFALGGLLAAGVYVTETNILGPLMQLFHPLNGETSGSINGRTWNLLLLGSDNDQKFVFPTILTQVMMVIHVNPFTNSITMVSLPRDSWVSVPGQGMHKIDQAFLLGAGQHHIFDDGVRLARATIEQDYGIPIDRYAWVGLDGFASVIDTLGGIDIDVTHPLVDDSYPDDLGKSASASKPNPYSVKRVYLAPGPQHLSGEQALEYVRSRHADLVGDIGRTQRQQEVLQALKKKLDVSLIFNHLPDLFHNLSGKVYTDLSQSEVLSTANLVRNLPARSMQKLTLGPGQGNQNYGTLTRTGNTGTEQGQDILRPNCRAIQPLLNRIFDLGDTASCQVNGNGLP